MDDAAREALIHSATRVADWRTLPDAAEAHGLAPLVHRHLTEAGVKVPTEIRQQLFGLAELHRETNRVRFRALGEVCDTFAAAGIRVILLKGAALAHLIYPSVGLRPSGDFDLLVDASQAAEAQSVLAELGYSADAFPLDRRLASHHHLPAASKLCDGYFVQIELHTDAFSRDVREALTLACAAVQQQMIDVDGRTLATLGHADMLHHLCRHLAERSSLLRLIWVADVAGYAEKYSREIAWNDLRERHPFVLNALSLLHLITPLPAPVLEHVTPPRGQDIHGVGVTCTPLSDAVQWHRPLAAIAHDLFAPSEWWIRLYYGATDRSSARWCRWVTHPFHVGCWFARRAGAYARWWVTPRSERTLRVFRG
jgi:hypothetical protein